MEKEPEKRRLLAESPPVDGGVTVSGGLTVETCGGSTACRSIRLTVEK